MLCHRPVSLARACQLIGCRCRVEADHTIHFRSEELLRSCLRIWFGWQQQSEYKQTKPMKPKPLCSRALCHLSSDLRLASALRNTNSLQVGRPLTSSQCHGRIGTERERLCLGLSLPAHRSNSHASRPSSEGSQLTGIYIPAMQCNAIGRARKCLANEDAAART